MLQMAGQCMGSYGVEVGRGSISYARSKPCFLGQPGAASAYSCLLRLKPTLELDSALDTEWMLHPTCSSTAVTLVVSCPSAVVPRLGTTPPKSFVANSPGCQGMFLAASS